MSVLNLIQNRSLPFEYSYFKNLPEPDYIPEVEWESYNDLVRAARLYFDPDANKSLRSVAGNVTASRAKLGKRFDLALEMAPDGKIWGMRAFLRYNPECRKPYKLRSDSDKARAGLFTKWVNDPKNKLFKKFVDEKIGEGWPIIDMVAGLQVLAEKLHRSLEEYPFNTLNQGYNAISDRRRKRVKTVAQGVEMAGVMGGKDAGRSAAVNQSKQVNRRLIRPFQRFELDEHVLHQVNAAQFAGPDGLNRLLPLRRLTVIAVRECATSAVVGWARSYNLTNDVHDVAFAIANALDPLAEDPSHVPGFIPTPGAGLPGQVIPACRFMMSAEIGMDNALAHKSRGFLEQLKTRMFTQINLGQKSMPEGRSIVELVFKQLCSVTKTLPSTTGSRPNDPSRRNPEQKTLDYLITDVLATSLVGDIFAEMNTDGGAKGLSPLNYLRRYVVQNPQLPNRLPLANRDLGFIFKRPFYDHRIVGTLSDGLAYINFKKARYYGPKLLAFRNAHPRELIVFYLDVRNAQFAQVYTLHGHLIDSVRVKGRWDIPHTLRTRLLFDRLVKDGHMTANVRRPMLALYEFLHSNVEVMAARRNELVRTAEDEYRSRILANDGSEDPAGLIELDEEPVVDDTDNIVNYEFGILSDVGYR